MSSLNATSEHFLDLDAPFRDPATSKYAIVPVPYEGTVSYKGGTAEGPAAVINASAQVELFDEELQREFHLAGVTTCPPIKPAGTAEAQVKRIREATGPIAARGQFILAVGGEHGITVPLVQVASQQHGPVSVLQIDAHADLRDSYEGTKYSHACVMRRVLETTDQICQVGVRSHSKEEHDACPAQIEKLLTPAMIHDDPDWTDRALDMLGENVYVTVDMDGFDPSVAPGVGTPEPGGLTWREVTGLLRRVCGARHVVGADIAEVRPVPGNHITEFVAARLACKIIAYTQK